MAHMVKFLYTQDYDEGDIGCCNARLVPKENPGGDYNIPLRGPAHVIHAKVYILADRYNIQPLKDLATLKYGGAPFILNDDSFVNSLELLYEQTHDRDRGLKDLAIKMAAEHSELLMDREMFPTLCKANGDIAFDVFQAFVNRTATPRVCVWHNTTRCMSSRLQLTHGNAYPFKCSANGKGFY